MWPQRGCHPGVFSQRVRKWLKRREMRFSLCKEWQRAKVMKPGGVFSHIGNPDGYQKKGVRDEAKRIVVKTKEIANLAQIGKRRRVGPSQRSLRVVAALSCQRTRRRRSGRLPNKIPWYYKLSSMSS